MKRDYKDNSDKEDITYFVGKEIEATPAENLTTLFVVGLQDAEEIIFHATAENATHIYLGANQCFTEIPEWNTLAMTLLNERFRVTLDYPVSSHEWVSVNCAEAMLQEYFIPQISVKIPNIKSCNKNTTVKIDDIDFNATNPGVWCWSLNELKNPKKFTKWDEYKDDKIIR